MAKKVIIITVLLLVALLGNNILHRQGGKTQAINGILYKTNSGYVVVPEPK